MIKSMNHTQLPNEIIDVHMKNLSHISFKVIVIICRKTFGWHKETDSISVSQIIKLSGLSKSSVLRSVKELEDLKIIVVDRVNDNKTTNKYTINYETREEEIPHKCMPVSVRDWGGVCETPGGGVCETHTKEILSKETIKRKEQSTRIKKTEETDEQFNLFWNIYDNKKGKYKTFTLWSKLSQEEKDNLILSVPNYLQYLKSKNLSFKYNPENYIKDKRYKDYMIKEKSKFVDQYNR